MKYLSPPVVIVLLSVMVWSPIAKPSTDNSMPAGFIRDEAAQMLQLSAELDGFGVDGAVAADTSEWEQVAAGVVSNTIDNSNCGFGPFKNCWKLWRHRSENTYAVVIRGTIYDRDSIDEDLLANTLLAERVVIPAGQSHTISFRLASTSFRQLETKDWPTPEVHAGFAYGLAAILFDRTYGLLKTLQTLPSGSRMFITGHSQGAAVATLLHSFLHYACADDSTGQFEASDSQNFADCPRFGLEQKNLSIKSYVFAQPKPGNWRYAMDLSGSIGNKGLFYTINNYDDPVVQVPLARQLLTDSLTTQEAVSIDRHRFLTLLMLGTAEFRRHISRTLNERILDDRFYRDYGKGAYADQIDTQFADGNGRKGRGRGGTSLNYTPAGNIIAVRAGPDDNDPRNEATRLRDFLWEHHMWRYQELSKYWP